MKTQKKPQPEMFDYFVIVDYTWTYAGGREAQGDIYGKVTATSPETAAEAVARKLNVTEYNAITRRRVARIDTMDEVDRLEGEFRQL